MKILIASDIHGRKDACLSLVKRIESEKPDEIWLLGDIMYNGPRNGVPSDYEPMEVSKMLLPYVPKTSIVCGNCDSRVDMMLLGKEMPLYIRKNAFNREFVLLHGDIYDGLEIKAMDIVVYGHTHVYSFGVKNSDHYEINPGSIGFPKNGNPRTYMTLEDGSLELKELSTGETLESDLLP